MKKQTICVLFGGVSPEHAVSCRSAAMVVEHIDRERFDILPVGIRRDGAWILTADCAETVRLGAWESDASGKPVVFSPSRAAGESGLLIDGVWVRPDCVFPVMHGENGEDGSIQGLFQLAGIPFVGCGVASSAVCMDKILTKIVCTHGGIAQADWVAATDWSESAESVADRCEAALPYPMFVKPANTGSSVGVSKAKDRAALIAAINEARQFDRRVLIEENIDGYEMECAVMGNNAETVSGIGQILPTQEFYSYDAKYNDASSELIFDPDLPQVVTDELRTNAAKVYRLLDCKEWEKKNDLDSETLFAMILTTHKMIDEMFDGDVTAAYKSIMQLEDAIAQVEAGKKELASGKREMAEGKKRILAAKATLEEGRAEYEKGLKELEDGQKELNEESEKARIELDKAKQELEDLPDAEWIVLDRTSHFSSYMFENNSDQMAKIGYVFPVLFFLVAALVCMTTMKRLVDEERSQIGVFSALGFSSMKIASKYIIYALAASLAGSMLAIPIGMGIFPTVVYFCWRLMYDLPDMVMTMPAYIAVLGVCSFTLLMALVTFAVARGVLKENPSRLMRPKAPKTAKKIFLEYSSPLWKRMSFTSKVTARNIIRYKSRFFMTVIGVAGCTSLLVLGFAIKDSVSQVVSIQYGDIITYDTTMTLENSDDMEAMLETLKDDRDVLYAVPHMTYSSMAYLDGDEKAISIYVMEEDEISDIIDLRQRKNGQPLDIRNGAVISEKFSKLYGISVGDDITVESSNGIKKEVEVTGICEMYTQHYLFISRENYEDIFNETVYYDSIALTSAEGADLTGEYKEADGVKSIVDFSGMKATFNNMFDSLDIIIVVIILAAGSLALVVIMNLTEVNISERIREIATLKVLGFNNNEVYSYIFKEVFILSLIGIVTGLPFGKLELVFVMDIIDMEMVMFSTAVKPASYLYAFLITLTFTVLVILLMRKTLRNVKMVESLKSVE